MSKRLEMLEMVASKKPDDPFVWYARAMELRSLDRKDEALAAFGDVATKFPTYVPTYLMGAQVAAELGRTDEARAFAQRGIEQARAGGDGHALSELDSFLATL
ncbi:tetratricopeptide repeat protein [Sandaracinus amylolyticus]|uniref:Uncharacterized protein n=1 Tax=Sandaracinus amylolyticus TaxID=927083 RepID=A0A0F6SEZ0_9BACT|nr:hypothetical protein [Sandaracinus amylolyticus]AKF06029.1 hypothetical protein DB32_003178 [Sandaracinus amylolyticus]